MTLELLSQLDLSAVGEQFERRQRRFASVTRDTAPDRLSQWNACACERLRAFGVQEKLIAVLGDEMNRWDNSLIDAATFEHGLGRLAASCSTLATATTQAMLAENETTPVHDSSVDAFWKAVFAMAIAIATRRHDDDLTTAKLPTHTTLTQFGTHLVNVWGGRSS